MAVMVMASPECVIAPVGMAKSLMIASVAACVMWILPGLGVHGTHSIGRFLELLLTDGPILIGIETSEDLIHVRAMAVMEFFG
jgi:hypothetical protein